ncbi:MAG TPA: bifunctional transaldolase/phosoglucose isomerase [Terriglobia bacterium]|nr:bifunctional transaldolase/phosoglucose isomerase [Terriglobia bacterium]
MSEISAKWSFSPGGLGPAVGAALAKLQEERFGQRLWERDPGLWKSEPEHQRVIKNALGWLSVPGEMLQGLDQLQAFVDQVRGQGFKHAVLLGMGGSSLCPDVFRATFGTAPGFLELQVLDSTVPASVAWVEKGIDLNRTLFIVSSKSGGTAETLSFYKYFFDRVKSLKGDLAGENFVAITDPGSFLEKLAREKGFRSVFPGQPDIGGRFSALSNFGIVPAALAGVDVRALLESGAGMARACGADVPAQENPGVALGAILGEAGRAGRDKVTFLVSRGIETFGDWVEQLLAESTGKEGKGLVPVEKEYLGEPGVYGNDRLFVRMALNSEMDDKVEEGLKTLEAAGHPVVHIELADKLDLGAEFFRWEVATAAAGALLGINPFDQPNVQESKINTNRLLAQCKAEGRFAEETPAAEAEELELYCDPASRETLVKISQRLGLDAGSLEAFLAAFLQQRRPNDYVALLAYVEASSGHKAVMRAMRMRLRDGLRLATTVGFGPRYLHSTGQLHKGGSNNGLFIQITAHDAEDLPVPGEPFTFSVLKQAQALGDFESLRSKGRRVIRFHVGKKVQAGLDRLSTLMDEALRLLQEGGK